MKIEKIRSLASLLGEFDLEELSLQEGEDKVSLRRPSVSGLQNMVLQPATTPVATVAAANGNANVTPAVAEEENSADGGVGTGATIKAPMVGMFYTAAAPDEPPFVQVGQKVAVGDVLCIIEAMKLMNEIVAEQAGVITHCHQENGQLVEFGQPLFQIEEA